MKHLFLVEEIQILKKHAHTHAVDLCGLAGGASTQKTVSSQANIGRTDTPLAFPQLEDAGTMKSSPSPSTIRASRLSLGLTQSQAGALVGVTDRAWRAWEAGFRVMPGSKWELFNLKTKELRK